MIHQYLRMQLSEFCPSDLPVHFHPPYFKLLHGLTLIHNTQRPCIKRDKKTYLLKPFIWLSKRTFENIGKFSFMCKLEREDVQRDIQYNKVQSAHHAN